MSCPFAPQSRLGRHPYYRGYWAGGMSGLEGNYVLTSLDGLEEDCSAVVDGAFEDINGAISDIYAMLPDLAKTLVSEDTLTSMLPSLFKSIMPQLLSKARGGVDTALNFLVDSVISKLNLGSVGNLVKGVLANALRSRVTTLVSKYQAQLQSCATTFDAAAGNSSSAIKVGGAIKRGSASGGTAATAAAGGTPLTAARLIALQAGARNITLAKTVSNLYSADAPVDSGFTPPGYESYLVPATPTGGSNTMLLVAAAAVAALLLLK